MRNLRSVNDRTYDRTKKAMFGTGVGPVERHKRLPTMAEWFGRDG